MSTKLVLKTLVGAAAIGQLLTVSSQANATAYAYSALQITNYVMSNEFGGFSTFEFTSQPLSASLTGFAPASTAQIVSNVPGGTTNPTQVKLGSTGFAADNAYFGANRPTLLNPPGNFAVADSHQTNTTILSGSGGVFGSQSGAQVSGGSAGAASTGTLNSLSWTFNVSAAEIAAADATPGVVRLAWSFDTLRNIRVETTQAGETARATMGFTINLQKDGVTLKTRRFDDQFDANDELIEAATLQQVLNLQSGPGSAGSSSEISQSFSSAFNITSAMGAGDYTFNILYDTSTQVSSVALPEPGTVGLIGLGLIGLGAAYRRKRTA
jgi:hypothetical protein